MTIEGKKIHLINIVRPWCGNHNRSDDDGSYDVGLLAIEDVVPHSDDLVVRRIARNTVMNELIYHLSKFDS
ncbi:hypothetical protein, partial [Globicatella sulfidifaciens]